MIKILVHSVTAYILSAGNGGDSNRVDKFNLKPIQHLQHPLLLHIKDILAIKIYNETMI